MKNFHMSDSSFYRYLNVEYIDSGNFYKNVLAICSDQMESDQQGLYIYPGEIKVIGVDEL